MGKHLSEMTLDELWELFPIVLKEHDECFNAFYNEEKEKLVPMLPQNIKIHHIGSTSINDIWAKPIVDILVEADINDFEAISSVLIQNGYMCMAKSDLRVDFCKGYTEDGFASKVFHLHLRNFCDNDELYFRDYLNTHPDIAKEYEKLKLSLCKRFEHDRDGYTKSKTAFVRKYTDKAILEMGRIYE